MKIYSPTTAAELIDRSIRDAEPVSIHMRTGLCDKWDTWTVTIVEMG